MIMGESQSVMNTPPHIVVPNYCKDGLRKVLPPC